MVTAAATASHAECQALLELDQRVGSLCILCYARWVDSFGVHDCADSI